MLRITGGELRGRRIAVPKGRATRPTAEKVRAGIFDTLVNLTQLVDAAVLDLFAGSGALGIEALSRGAANVVFLEAHGKTAAAIRATLRNLELPPQRWRVVTARVQGWLKQPGPEIPPGVVLLDPPYAGGEGPAALDVLAASPAVPAGALLVLETAARSEAPTPDGLELVQMKRYGDTQILFLRKNRAVRAAAEFGRTR